MKTSTTIKAFAASFGLAAGAHAQTGGGFDLTWNTLDGGGAASNNPSVGGGFVLYGTIGQHDAGECAGGAFTIHGGFWASSSAPPCYADCDTSTGPGILDIFDFLCFQNRYDSRNPYACNCDTGTGLGVCDIFDFLCFQNAFAGGCR